MSFSAGNDEIALAALGQNHPHNSKMTTSFVPPLFLEGQIALNTSQPVASVSPPATISRVAALWRLFQG
jgi:hypothetical protein